MTSSDLSMIRLDQFYYIGYFGLTFIFNFSPDWEDKMSDSNNLTEYEKTQVDEILKWKREEPGVVATAINVMTYPATWLIQRIIPDAAIRAVLNAADWMANNLTDANDILRDAKVSKISELKNKDLALCDRLANEVHNWAIGFAIAEGGITGAFAIGGLVADVPAIITLALRTIHKIGLCYGYENESEMDRNFIFGILAASGANSMKEKLAALATLRAIQMAVAKQTWKTIAEKAAMRQLSIEGGIITIKNLAKQLGINLTKRKILTAIPVIGSVVGASVNGWFIKDVGWAARRTFQEKWLIDNNKIIEI